MLIKLRGRGGRAIDFGLPIFRVRTVQTGPSKEDALKKYQLDFYFGFISVGFFGRKMFICGLRKKV